MRLWMGIFLTIHAATDVWGGYIYLPVVWIQMVTGVAVMVWSGVGTGTVFWQLLPGLGVFAVSMSSREKIGCGDAWLLMATGLYLGIWQQLQLWCAASILAFLWTMSGMVAGRVDKHTEIVLAPFIWLGYLGGSCFGWF